MPSTNFQPIRLFDPSCAYKFKYLMPSSADPDQKPTDLDLHCLQRQGISGLSRTKVISTLPRCLNYFFLNSENLMCRGTEISKCFRESLGIRDNESRLYHPSKVFSILEDAWISKQKKYNPVKGQNAGNGRQWNIFQLILMGNLWSFKHYH